MTNVLQFDDMFTDARKLIERERTDLDDGPGHHDRRGSGLNMSDEQTTKKNNSVMMWVAVASFAMSIVINAAAVFLGPFQDVDRKLDAITTKVDAIRDTGFGLAARIDVMNTRVTTVEHTVEEMRTNLDELRRATNTPVRQPK